MATCTAFKQPSAFLWHTCPRKTGSWLWIGWKSWPLKRKEWPPRACLARFQMSRRAGRKGWHSCFRQQKLAWTRSFRAGPSENCMTQRGSCAEGTALVSCNVTQFDWNVENLFSFKALLRGQLWLVIMWLDLTGMLKIWLSSLRSVGVHLLDSSVHLGCGLQKAVFFQLPPSLLKNYSADEISFPEQFLHEVRQIRIVPAENIVAHW